MTGQTHKIEGITQQSNPGQSEERAKHGRGGSVEKDGCVPNFFAPFASLREIISRKLAYRQAGTQRAQRFTCLLTFQVVTSGL